MYIPTLKIVYILKYMSFLSDIKRRKGYKSRLTALNTYIKGIKVD